MNQLFPIFLKLDNLTTLIVGGGNVALEKLTNILKSSPSARIKLVATSIDPAVVALASSNPQVQLVERSFKFWDLWNVDVVILATNNRETNQRIRQMARRRKKLVNVADTPDLCDFYLGSVVTKGDLKLGISTNGKSPTIAKRMREFLEDAIPDDTQQLIDNMNSIRDNVKGGLQEKIRTLNEITGNWLSKPKP